LPISGGDEAVQKSAKADAQSELDALTPRIPNVVVNVEGANPSAVSVSIDGTALSSALLGEPRPINPGAHHIVGTRGSDRVEVSVTVAEGEKKTALLRFTPEAAAANATPASPKSTAAPNDNAAPQAPTASSSGPWRTIGVVTGAVGVVGIGVGAAFGLKAKSSNNQSNADGHCDASGCDATGISLRQVKEHSAHAAPPSAQQAGSAAAVQILNL
jgi:hypothetical protein